MAYVKEKHLWAIFTSELVGSCDQPPNSLHMHSQVGEAAATQDVVGLGDCLADPCFCALRV